MGSFYTLPVESLVMSIQLPKLNHSIHSQEDSDNNSEAYIAISYDSVEYRKLLKKVKKCVYECCSSKIRRGQASTHTNICRAPKVVTCVMSIQLLCITC